MIVSDTFPGLLESESTKTLTTALIKAQSGFPTVEKGGENTYGKYKYMRYGDIAEAVRESLNANGLTLPVVCLTKFDGDWAAVGTLRHASGEFITTVCPLYFGVDKDGNEVRDMQRLGAAYTYAKKYILLGLIGCWAEDDDDAQSIKSERGRAAGDSTRAPVKAAKATKGKDRSLVIEQAAKSEIDNATDEAQVQGVLKLLKLRVSEGVASPGVLERCIAYASQWKRSREGGEEVSDGGAE